MKEITSLVKQENVLEKWYFPKDFFFFKAVSCSRGMWKMVRPRWVGCECALQKKIPLIEILVVCAQCVLA